MIALLWFNCRCRLESQAVKLVKPVLADLLPKVVFSALSLDPADVKLLQTHPKRLLSREFGAPPACQPCRWLTSALRSHCPRRDVFVRLAA